MNVLPCQREWHERHIAVPTRERVLREQTAKLEARRAIKPKVKTPATELELRAIAAISPGRVTYCPGIGTKRFARDIQGATELTDKQRMYLWQVVWKFRRQIQDAELVSVAQQKAGK